MAEELCMTDARGQAVPVILELLRKIHSTRIGGKEFDLAGTTEFKSLTALRKAA